MASWRSVPRVALRPVGDLGTTDGIAVLGSEVFHSVHLFCVLLRFFLPLLLSLLRPLGLHVDRPVMRKELTARVCPGTSQCHHCSEETSGHGGRCKCAPCYHFSCRGYPPLLARCGALFAVWRDGTGGHVEAAGCTGTCLLTLAFEVSHKRDCEYSMSVLVACTVNATLILKMIETPGYDLVSSRRTSAPAIGHPRNSGDWKRTHSWCVHVEARTVGSRCLLDSFMILLHLGQDQPRVRPNVLSCRMPRNPPACKLMVKVCSHTAGQSANQDREGEDKR